MSFFFYIVCPVFTVLSFKFLFYSEAYTYNLMSCKLLALFLCIYYMAFLFLKYTLISVVRYAFTHTMSFLEMELTERKPKYMTVYFNRNYFTHIIDGSCSLHVIGIPCKNLPCKMETWLLTVSSIGKWSVILKILIWDQEHKKS